MISRIFFKEHIPPYSANTEITPVKVNYIFGNNGCGKTVLSKIIENPESYPKCDIGWTQTRINTLVYNRDFVKANFALNNPIKGIFTLGAGSIEAKEYIENKNKDLEQIKNEITGYEKEIENNITKGDELTNDVYERAWKIKIKYEELETAFQGFHNSKKNFFNKCLETSEYKNVDLLAESEIKEKYKKIFESKLEDYDLIDNIEYSELSNIERSNILNTKIVGKEDIEIGALIKKLNNSDWVKNGLMFMKQTEDENTCPFCQQQLNDRIKAELEEYFDDTYLNRIKELAEFKRKYKEYISSKIEEIKTIENRNIAILNHEELSKQIKLLETAYIKNLLVIDSKIKEPSNIITLDSLQTVFEEIDKIVKKYCELIEENNNLFKNFDAERDQLKNEIWKFIYNSFDDETKLYPATLNDILSDIIVLQNKIKNAEKRKNDIESEIQAKEVEVTSTKHSANEINDILAYFNFNNFKISASDNGYYKIVRDDDSPVNDTLSEGEYNFITFLYFYHLLKGSAESKVVVIDDPISSLDSNVMFIVSQLVKGIIDDCQKNESGIKQIFILSHNVYFYKEVTYRDGYKKRNGELFWILRKIDDVTKIKRYEENQIMSSYELLWREVREYNSNPESFRTISIHNTLRRILEYYFKILGNTNYKKDINDKFEGKERIVCKSLVSRINDGSHSINEDLNVVEEFEDIKKYLEIFRLIFEKMDHISHYNMMMGITEKSDE